MTALREALLAFDGNRTDVLTDIEAQYANSQDYVSALVELIGDPEAHLSSGSTWLLKSRLEKGGATDPSQTARMIAKLDGIREWQAKLHICKCIRFLNWKDSEAEILADWLEPLLTDDRPFLRAWSLDALCAAASEQAGLEDKAKAGLQAALDDKAASVRARARKLASKMELR